MQLGSTRQGLRVGSMPGAEENRPILAAESRKAPRNGSNIDMEYPVENLSFLALFAAKSGYFA